MRHIGRHTTLGLMALAAGIAVVDGDAAWRAAWAEEISGIDARVVIEHLHAEQDVSIRRALILALGGYSAAGMPLELRQQLVPRLLRWYRDDPDPGIHGAPAKDVDGRDKPGHDRLWCGFLQRARSSAG